MYRIMTLTRKQSLQYRLLWVLKLMLRKKKSEIYTWRIYTWSVRKG